MPAGLAAAHGAGQLDRAGVEQQLLGQRRLAGVGVRDDRERPPPRDLAFELGGRGRVGLVGQLDWRRIGKAHSFHCTGPRARASKW